MSKIIHKITKSFLISSLLVTPFIASGEESDMPLMLSFKTNIYNYQGPTNSFTIYLGSIENDIEVLVKSPTSEEYISLNPWNVGTDEDGDKTVIATPVSVTVTEGNNEVKIYGDKTKIDYIDLHGCYLSSVDLNGEFPNLSVIDLSHNELTEIDLSQQTSLASIDLTDNAFKVADKMIIGENHPGLQILSIGINDVCDPNLNLTNFPNLQYFSARNNYGLYQVDPTKCPELVSLVLEVTNVSSIDVSKCPLLDVLNLSQTRVKEVDLSQNKNLGEFYINHEGSYNNTSEFKLTSIDLSNNPMLQYLDLGGNNLSEIDLSNNPDIRLLYLQRNNLSSIDIKHLSKLAVLNLSNNQFTFANLPIPEEGWDYYYYRTGLPTELKYKVGEPIDFSSSVIRAPFVNSEGVTITPMTYAAVFAIPKGGDEYEVETSKYNYDKGIITFKEALADSVYVQFYCDVFPDYPLNTQQFMVKSVAEYDAPSAAFSFVPSKSELGKEVSISLGALSLSENLIFPTDVTVIIDGKASEYKNVVKGTTLPSTPNLTFILPENDAEITIALKDGYAVSALGIDGIEISSINLTPAEGLEILEITNCGLSSIDLSYNRTLTNLDLSGNNLSYLTLAGIRGDYEKFSLANINLSNNKLTGLGTVSASTIKNLNLSGNNISSFDLKYYTGLQSIDLSNNKIEGEIDFSKVEQIRSINIQNNKINNLILNDEDGALDGLVSLNVKNNNLTLATLPILNSNGISYEYAPQNLIEILSTGPAINLSSQNIIVNGMGSNFTWKYSDNNTVVSQSDYVINDGATVFNESLVGKTLYCEITNPVFPGFDNSPLTTTNVTVASKPQNLVATFVTPESGTAEIGFRFYKSGDNAVYIDWKGDGSEYEPYIYEANVSYPSIYRTGTTYAGATAKVYSYDEADNISVFAMNNTPLSSLDLSPMTMLSAVNVHSAGLTDGSLILPKSEEIFELVFDGNNFEKADFGEYKKVSSLNLANNNLTEINLSDYPMLSFAQLSGNKISEINFGDEAYLIQIDLSSNNLKTIDLSGVYSIGELLLSDNFLSEIDLTPVANTLRALVINGNNFTFATLPDISEMGGQFTTYYYGNQKPMEVECEDYKINLSDQAYVNGEPTIFYWFLGDYQSDVYYDAETEMFVGEMLEGPEDSEDPEYSIEDGITTFLYPQSRSVICAMMNSEYPNLILYTSPTRITDAGVKNIFNSDDGFVDVYTISGIKVKSHVKIEEALRNLNKGLYIIGGRKILVQ